MTRLVRHFDFARLSFDDALDLLPPKQPGLQTADMLRAAFGCWWI
jgi:hypothetical protein